MAHLIVGRYSVPLRPVILAGILAAMLTVGLLIWPTRWVIVSTDTRVYRVDRFTGCYQFTTDTGWSRPWQRTC